MEYDKEDLRYRTELMGNIKSVLLATDGSKYSEGAVREGLLLAKSCTTRLTLLYVLGLSDTYETGGLTYVERIGNDMRDYLNRWREKAAEENVELEIVIRRASEAYKTIINEAIDRKADVIIMGRRGMSGLQRLIMGSVTAKVIAYSPCNVLVVPHKADIKGKTLMLATDGSEYSEHAQNEAVSMAKRCPYIKSFIALSVAGSEDTLPEAKSILDNVQKHADNEGVSLTPVSTIGTPYESILKQAERNNVSLIIMGTHGRTGISKLMLGSVAERVIALAACAVLVVK
jgi:nucleotide-binding universal stress UspA family protein